MPSETQGKLLRLLVEQQFHRLGGHNDVQVDVRVITSTSHDLSKYVEAGKFREDLYHRLNVMPLEAPTLSERREDIPLLVEHFIKQLAASTGLPARQVGPDAMAALQAHDWPGNVRQLRNNVERLLILATGEPSQPISLETLRFDGNISRTASFVGMERSALHRKLKSLGLGSNGREDA